MTKEDEVKIDLERQREIGRLEGMIAYQKHLIENMQKENVQLTEKLKKLKGE